MHYKKRKLFVLYSIPIWFRKRINNFSKSNLCKEKLYLVSYSIPLSCMVVLLLTGIMVINPSLSLKTSAVTIQDEWVVKDSNSSSSSNSDYGSPASVKGENNNSNSNASTTSETSNNTNINSIDDSFGGFGGDEVEPSQEDMDAGISPMSITTQPSLTLSIGKTTVETSTVQGGNTAYAANNVTLSGSYVKDYTLSIKAGSANLTMPSGADSSTSTISGVGSGTVGSSMSANKWGYAVAETSNTNYAGLTYKTTPTSATTILSGAGNTESSTSMNVSKQLVFAAKFGDEATPGKYSASITLSVTATPKTLTMSNITDMQDMTPEICANSGTGQTATLTDNRGGYNSGTITGASGKTHTLNQYEVVKHTDGNCWMQENLRIGRSSSLSLSSSNTDLASGASSWTLPADKSWTTGNNTLAQIRVGSTSLASGWQPLYGNYYSWCAATADSCSVLSSRGFAVSSICPKGWALPTLDQYNALFGGDVLGSTGAEKVSRVQESPYFFPLAGYVSSESGRLSVGTTGEYYSREGTNVYTYYLNFNGSYFIIGQGYAAGVGRTIRCVVASY